MKLSNQPICPKCAALIPDEAPGGLCPKCALEGAATVSNNTSGGSPPGIGEIAPHFPDLEILELLGAGGMGAVYKARQPQLDRFVALKILSHHLASDPAFVERFNREARVLGRLSHPNIVGIHDFGTAGPYCYLLMEYVDGVNLRQAMRAGRFTPTEALETVQHLCSALKFAHEEGILHRDIKPENILIDSKGRVKIADFGIAKLVGEDREQDFTLTLQGSVLGSPHYMAPEQIETPGDVDQRADIYSLGVVLYEMLTGGLPLGRFALPSEKAEMDARIDHIVMRTLEKERGARYQSAGEVSTEVEALGKNPSPPAIKATASPAEPEAARFNLTAVILTGLSLVLVALVAILVGVIHPGVATGPVEQKKFHLMFASIMLFIGLPAAISAVTGFIFGTRALGEIRASGGVKSGLGNSIFATTAWPILFLFVLATLSLKIPSSGEGPTLGPETLEALIFVVLLPVLAAAWLLVRSLYRWAGGAERKDGTRFHPGLGIPLLMMMLLTIGGPILIMVGVHLFRGGKEDRWGVSDTHRIEWYRGRPEVSFPIRIDSGIRATFRLVQRDGKGGQRITNAGEATTLSPDTFTIDIGAYKVPDSEDRLFQELAITVKSSRDTLSSFTGSDFSGWEFTADLPDVPVMIGPDRREFQLASRRSADGTHQEVLVFEVETTLQEK
jgi:tRNA A-37 threonylcarbamoyl transferase component Bud32